MIIVVFDDCDDGVLQSIDDDDIHVECSHVVPDRSGADSLIFKVSSGLENDPKKEIVDAPEVGPLPWEIEDIEGIFDVADILAFSCNKSNAETMNNRTCGIET
jgi:hypothetical protein